jgi:hypothetical protein
MNSYIKGNHTRWKNTEKITPSLLNRKAQKSPIEQIFNLLIVTKKLAIKRDIKKANPTSHCPRKIG